MSEEETKKDAAAACPTECALLCADQLLAILVMDFGYTKEPLHGHTPLRHQFAWSMCQKTIGTLFNEKVREMAEQAAEENKQKRVIDAMRSSIAEQIEAGGSGRPYD